MGEGGGERGSYVGKICIPPRRKAIIIMSHQVMEAIVKQQPNKLQLYLCLTL